MALEPRRYAWPRLSPDGSRLALDILETGNRDVWSYDLKRHALTRLTFNPADDRRPLWTRDGQRVVFTSLRDGQFNLFWQAADGTGQAERLISHPNPGRTAFSFSPDGKKLAFQEIKPETGYDLHLLLLEGQPTSRPLLQTPSNESSPAISPDGRWIAYSSDESGGSQIYVRPFPETDKGQWQISTKSGNSPLWSPDGRELFYQDGEAMMVVAVETTGSFSPAPPKLLFTGKYDRGGGLRNFDITPDGRRFIMIKETGPTLDPSARDQLTIVLNWFEELRQLVPAGK